MILGGSNTYSDGTTVLDGGTLRLTNDKALLDSAPLAVEAGGTLEIADNIEAAVTGLLLDGFEVPGSVSGVVYTSQAGLEAAGASSAQAELIVFGSDSSLTVRSATVPGTVIRFR